jgi:hypothetical protein
MHDPDMISAATDLHERAEAALGWVDEDVSAVGAESPRWVEQALEELAAGSVTGKLLGRRADAV